MLINNDIMLEEFKKGVFYTKYKDTYFADSILKDIFGEKITKHRFYGKNYEDVYNKNLEVISEFIKYIKKANIFDEETKKNMLKSIYIDPDMYSEKEQNGVICTADGLISLNRMYSKYGITDDLLSEYQQCRKTPIFHFPSERNGINMLRATVFGDRIDHTLFDLKRYCENANDCKLKSAYELPKTKKWLDGFDKDFPKIVKAFNIDGIFVDKDNSVFDLEKNDGTHIDNYNELYSRQWSNTYYDSLKGKIIEFENRVLKKL